VVARCPACDQVLLRLVHDRGRAWLDLHGLGRSFADRRDTAIIRIFVDTGMRLAEMTNLTLDDLDMDYEVAVVLGKGRRPHSCPFGAKAGQALDPYLQVRGGATSLFGSVRWPR
jgi:site-specific recombinase XerC